MGKELSPYYNQLSGTRISRYILALIFFASLAQPLQAQETERRLTFTEAARLLVDNNLSLQISKSQTQEQAALARQAAAYPNPSFSLTHEPLSRDGDSSSETYFNLIQPIEWPGLRSARIDAARRLTESAVGRFQADSLRLMYELAKAYIEADAAETWYQNILQITDIFREASRSADAQYASGEMSGYRMRRLRIERARYENRLALAQLELHRQQRRLAMLILPEESGIRIVPSSELAVPTAPMTLETALKQVEMHRAELISAQADVEAAGYSITATKKGVTPSPIITAGYKRQSNGFNGLYLGTLFDIPVFDQKRGAIDAASTRLHQAETRFLLMQRQIEQDVRQAYDAFVSLERRIELIADDLLAESSELLRAAQTSYSEGEITLLELLDASDAFYDAQTTTTMLSASSLVAYYDLMRATGHIPLN